MNDFIREISGLYNYSINYGDADGLYVEKKYWDLLDKANLWHGKKDYETGGILYSFFLAPKINYCLTIDEFVLFTNIKFSEDLLIVKGL